MGVFGIGHGFFFTSYNLVMVEVLGLSLLQPMLSVTGLFKSASFLIFGPLIGNQVLLHASSFFFFLFFFAILLLYFTTICLLLCPFLQCKNSSNVFDTYLRESELVCKSLSLSLDFLPQNTTHFCIYFLLNVFFFIKDSLFSHLSGSQCKTYNSQSKCGAESVQHPRVTDRTGKGPEWQLPCLSHSAWNHWVHHHDPLDAHSHCQEIRLSQGTTEVTSKIIKNPKQLSRYYAANCNTRHAERRMTTVKSD